MNHIIKASKIKKGDIIALVDSPEDKNKISAKFEVKKVLKTYADSPDDLKRFTTFLIIQKEEWEDLPENSSYLMTIQNDNFYRKYN